MIRRVNQYKGKKKAFYICQTKNKGGDCTRHSIPEEVLKKIVLKEIQAYTALFVDYQMIMEVLCEMKVSYDQVIGYDTQISKLQEEYNRYYSLKASLGCLLYTSATFTCIYTDQSGCISFCADIS